MKAIELKSQIYSVGAIDWDRRLFDSLLPLPDGTSYNSYLIVGSEKSALIDTVDPTQTHILIDHLDQLAVKKIDYVIANHAEQDHSGALPAVLAKYPGAKVVVTPKGKDMLMDLLLVPEAKFITVNDRETISLGNRILEFIHAPWVHWPETMLTYLKEERTLFSCDLFGSHLAATGLYVTDERQIYESAKRYYAEIMMPYRTNIQRHLERLKEYDIVTIAPSHGPVYDKPEFILKAYRSWVFDAPKNMVVLPYISMHGSVRRMVEHFGEALDKKGVTVKQFDLTVTDLGKLAIALVDAATIVIGTPTMLAGVPPTVAYAAFLANALRPKLKFAAVIGSYSWGGRAVEQLIGLIPNLKLDILGTVIARGFPKEADFKALDDLAETIAGKHKEQGFI